MAGSSACYLHTALPSVTAHHFACYLDTALSLLSLPEAVVCMAVKAHEDARVAYTIHNIICHSPKRRQEVGVGSRLLQAAPLG